jgi:hypothetical protein
MAVDEPKEAESAKIAATEQAIVTSPPLAPAMQPMADAAPAEPVTEAASPAPSVAKGLASDAKAFVSRLAGNGTGMAKLATPLAVTAAIVLGAFAGSLVTAHFSVEPAAITAEDTALLKSKIAKLEIDLVGLKTSLDAAGKAAGAQIAKVADRLDRSERAQAEPVAKLARISETLERLEKRSVASASDITGSITSPAETKPLQPPIVVGWTLRDVYDGVALVQGRYGLIEVERGDALPGLGRVEAIRKQDGRWSVVTAKGLIVQR